MRKILPTTLLGVAGLTAFGLIAMATPVVSATPDEAAKRDDDTPSLVLVSDDDDDDTNDDDDDDNGGDTNTNSPSYTVQSRDTKDYTNCRVTDVSRDRATAATRRATRRPTAPTTAAATTPAADSGR